MSNELTGMFTDSWLHELAQSELHPDGDRLLNMGKTCDPHQAVEEATIRFLHDLREEFNQCARVFNGYSESAARFQEVKIYQLAQTAADFMLYRNQVKLVVANSAHGVIQIEFAENQYNAMGVGATAAQGSGTGALGASAQNHLGPQELLANVGPFRDVAFTYQGEKVTPQQIAKYYFSEFVRATRESRKIRPNQQALLDQIRLLLQEKGLEL